MTLTRRPAAIPTVLSLGLLALYLAFLTKAYYWDGVVFAQAIEDVAGRAAPVSSLGHPNHLVYNFAGYFFYRLLRSLGLGGDLRAITALQILNCFFSAGSATILFLILRNTLRSTYLPACLTLLFALSATWWKFSTDANAYIPSVFFLLLSFYLVLPERRPHPVWCALSFFAAMCFHELAVIAFPVFALGVYLQDHTLASSRKLRNVIALTVVSSVLIVGAYAAAFYFASGSLNISRLLHWTASYSPDADTRFHLSSNLAYSLRGQVRLFFGGRLNLLRGLLNPAIIVLLALLALSVLWLLYAVLANLLTLKQRLRVGRVATEHKEVRPIAQRVSRPDTGRIVRRPDAEPIVWRPDSEPIVSRLDTEPIVSRPDSEPIVWPPPLLSSRARTVLLLGLVWVVVYLVFLFFWLPQNTFYRVFYLPGITILLGLALSALSTTASRRGFATAAFVIAAGLANFLFLIYPFSHVEKYPPLAFALQMNHEWPRDTVIYYAAQNSDEALVRYFTPGTQWKLLKEPFPPDTGAWLETTAIDRLSATPDGARWLQTHTRPETLHELNNGAYKIRFIQLSP